MSGAKAVICCGNSHATHTTLTRVTFRYCSAAQHLFGIKISNKSNDRRESIFLFNFHFHPVHVADARKCEGEWIHFANCWPLTRCRHTIKMNLHFLGIIQLKSQYTHFPCFGTNRLNVFDFLRRDSKSYDTSAGKRKTSMNRVNQIRCFSYSNAQYAI